MKKETVLDLRVLDRLIKKGDISEEEAEKHLASLPDDEPNCVWIPLTEFQDEGISSELDDTLSEEESETEDSELVESR